MISDQRPIIDHGPLRNQDPWSLINGPNSMCQRGKPGSNRGRMSTDQRLEPFVLLRSRALATRSALRWRHGQQPRKTCPRAWTLIPKVRKQNSSRSEIEGGVIPRFGVAWSHGAEHQSFTAEHRSPVRNCVLQESSPHDMTPRHSSTQPATPPTTTPGFPSGTPDEERRHRRRGFSPALHVCLVAEVSHRRELGNPSIYP
jgi:hypothetical protein